MKKHAPKILAVVLLSVIAVLMIVAGTGSLKDLFSGDQRPTDNKVDDIPSVDASSGNGVTTEGGSDQASPPTVEELPPSVNYFPISPEKSETNRFTQTLSLVNGALNASISTTEGNYVVVTHETKEGAFAVSKRTQTVVKVAFDGTVTKAYSIPNASETEFLASILTVEGLAIVVTDGKRCFLYTLSLDFQETMLLELPSFSKVHLFSLSDALLFFGSGAENAVYKIKKNVIASSNSLGIGEVKAVYDFASYYALFLAGINGYSFIKLDTSLKMISTVNIPNVTLLSVEPTVEAGEQKFISVELTSSGVEIAKYDLSFSISKSERVGVGLAEGAKVFINGESIFLLLHASSDRLYLVDKNLAFTASNNTTFQGISELFDCSTTREGYRVLYLKGESLNLVDVRNDGTTQTVNLDVKASSGFITENAIGGYSVTYLVDNVVTIVGIN